MEDALLKQAEELSSVNADLEQFAFVAAHDLQEPLRKIQAFGDRLNRKYKPILDEEGQDYVSRMCASATRMRKLIDDLLLFAKTTKRECSLVSLAKIAQEVILDLQDSLDETQGHIEVGYLPTLWANPVQIRQVLQNLLSNALKFHQPACAPKVSLMSKRAESQWHIYIKDNGIGFDEQYKDRIFKVFQRLHSRDKYEGTGMGLAIVRKVVESYEGSIEVYSCPGEGSTFILKFPIVSATQIPVSHSPSTQPTTLEVIA
jgi:light-regulated signal transduction histidine kinase (bacteriophytochrome)